MIEEFIKYVKNTFDQDIKSEKTKKSKKPVVKDKGEEKPLVLPNTNKDQNVLVIPDVHLKTEMFKAATNILHIEPNLHAVCLMDIADNWNKGLDFYRQTYDLACKFAKEFPTSLWCWGNHDLSYLWKKQESGFNEEALTIVTKKLKKLQDICGNRLAYIHRINRCIFMHGGLTKEFIRQHSKIDKHIDEILKDINALGSFDMWQQHSPIWHRPQASGEPMYGEDKNIFQVVGHTPVLMPIVDNTIISTDTFSVSKTGKHLGDDTFVIINSKTGNIERRLLIDNYL